jgi:hypothetical protein
VTDGQELSFSILCDSAALLEFVTARSDAVRNHNVRLRHEEKYKDDLVALPIPRSSDFSSELAVVSLKGRTLSPSALWLIDRMRELTIEFAKSVPTGNGPDLPERVAD